MTGDRPEASAIKEKNDAFRKAGFAISDSVGRKLHTAGVNALPHDVIAEIWQRVADFDAFTPDDDPHGEHDFGAFDHATAGRIFWKIDYYDASYEFGAENPADPDSRRVLTVMLAEEY